MTAQDDMSTELSRYVTVPLRRWRVVVVSVILGLTATAVVLFSWPATWAATTLVELHPITTSPFDANRSVSQLIDAATEAKTASSQVVAAQAAAKLTGKPSAAWMQQHVTVTADTGTTTLSFTFTAASAQEAVAGANAFADAYLVSRTAGAAERRNELTTGIDTSLSALRDQLATVNKKLATVDPTGADAQDELTTRTLLTQQYSDLTQRKNALTAMSMSPGQVVSPATEEGTRLTPSRKLWGVVGVLVWALLGIVTGFLREATDRRLRRAAQLERTLGAPVGKVLRPHGTRWPDEALYVQRSRLLNRLTPGQPRVLLVIDFSRTMSTGDLGTSLAEIIAAGGLDTRLLLVGDRLASSGMPLRLDDSDTDSLSGSLTTTHVPVVDTRDRGEQRALRQAVASAQRGGGLTIIATTGFPRRALIAVLANVADDVLVVAEAGHSTIPVLRQTVRDVTEAGAQVFSGLFVSRGRTRAKKAGTRKTGTNDAGANETGVIEEGTREVETDKAGAGEARTREVGTRSTVPQPEPTSAIPLSPTTTAKELFASKPAAASPSERARTGTDDHLAKTRPLDLAGLERRLAELRAARSDGSDLPAS